MKRASFSHNQRQNIITYEHSFYQNWLHQQVLVKVRSMECEIILKIINNLS